MQPHGVTCLTRSARHTRTAEVEDARETVSLALPTSRYILRLVQVARNIGYLPRHAEAAQAGGQLGSDWAMDNDLRNADVGPQDPAQPGLGDVQDSSGTPVTGPDSDEGHLPVRRWC